MSGTRRRAERGGGERLRSELVDAAIELLLDPAAAGDPSLRAIARSCGVAPSAVYMHFESQAALMYAVTAELFARLRAALAAAVSPDDGPDARLTSMIDAYLGWAADHSGAYQLLFERPDPSPDAGSGPGLDLLGQLGATLTDLDPDADAARAMQVWSVLHGIASLRIHKATAPWQSTAQEDAQAIIGALVTMDQSAP